MIIRLDNLKRKDKLGVLGMCERTILKWILQNYVVRTFL